MFESYLSGEGRPPCAGERCGYCFMKGFCAALDQAVSVARGGPVIDVTVDARSAAWLSNSARRGTIPGSVYFTGAGADEFFQASRHFSQASTVFADLKKKTTAKQCKDMAAMFPNVWLVARSGFSPRAAERAAAAGLKMLVILNRDFLRRFTAEPGILDNLSRGTDIAFKQENHIVLAEVLDQGIDLKNSPLSALLAAFPLVNVPPCVVMEKNNSFEDALDLGVFAGESPVDLDKFTDYFIQHAYYVKPQVCDDCSMKSGCRGFHINNIRAFGANPAPIIR